MTDYAALFDAAGAYLDAKPLHIGQDLPGVWSFDEKRQPSVVIGVLVADAVAHACKAIGVPLDHAMTRFLTATQDHALTVNGAPDTIAITRLREAAELERLSIWRPLEDLFEEVEDTLKWLRSLQTNPDRMIANDATISTANLLRTLRPARSRLNEMMREARLDREGWKVAKPKVPGFNGAPDWESAPKALTPSGYIKWVSRGRRNACGLNSMPFSSLEKRACKLRQVRLRAAAMGFARSDPPSAPANRRSAQACAWLIALERELLRRQPAYAATLKCRGEMFASPTIQERLAVPELFGGGELPTSDSDAT